MRKICVLFLVNRLNATGVCARACVRACVRHLLLHSDTWHFPTECVYVLLVILGISVIFLNNPKWFFDSCGEDAGRQ